MSGQGESGQGDDTIPAGELVALPAGPPRRSEPLLPSIVLGTCIFVLTEIMFFAGMISAFTVTRSWATGGIWPPPGQPRLPIEQTAFNTVVLLASGGLILWAGRTYRENPQKLGRLLVVCAVLGGAFVGLQGAEWVGLLSQGLTLTSSAHGSFFYLIVGSHSLHVVAGVVILAVSLGWHRAGTLTADMLWAVQIFWVFVVGLWPILYTLVYLQDST